MNKAAKKVAKRGKSSNSNRFFSLSEVSKHFHMPDVEVGVHVNSRSSQSIAETLRSVVASSIGRKVQGRRQGKQHAQ